MLTVVPVTVCWGPAAGSCQGLFQPHTLRMVSQAIPGTSVILAFPFQVPPKPPITWLHTWARWLPWSTYQLTLRVLKQNFKSVDFDQTFRSFPALEIGSLGNSLVVQWLGVHASCWWGPGFNPGQGTKIPQDVWCGKKKKKETTSLMRCHRPDTDSGTSDDRRACCAVIRVNVGLL